MIKAARGISLPRTLVVGATGFIGRQVVAELVARGVPTIPHGRSAKRLLASFPEVPGRVLELAGKESPQALLGLLEGVDCVVYAAGIMGELRRNRYAVVHDRAAALLFSACVDAGVEKVILISALGSAAGTTGYWASKRAGEQQLLALSEQGRIRSVAVVRPSVVIGRGGASDGLFRGLAALPRRIGIIGDRGTLAPIHVQDLARMLASLVLHGEPLRITVDAGGPSAMTLAELLSSYRQALGLPANGCVLLLPSFASAGARVAAWLDAPSPIHPEAIRMMAQAPPCDRQSLPMFTGIPARSAAVALSAEGHARGDLAEARSFFLGLVGRLSLACLWLTSGILPLTPAASPSGIELLGDVGVIGPAAVLLLWLASLADIALGMALILNWRPMATGVAQLALIAAFTLILSAAAPSYWLHPFGPVLKNLPILALVLVVMAREGRLWTRCS